MEGIVVKFRARRCSNASTNAIRMKWRRRLVQLLLKLTYKESSLRKHIRSLIKTSHNQRPTSKLLWPRSWNKRTMKESNEKSNRRDSSSRLLKKNTSNWRSWKFWNEIRRNNNSNNNNRIINPSHKNNHLSQLTQLCPIHPPHPQTAKQLIPQSPTFWLLRTTPIYTSHLKNWAAGRLINKSVK